MELSQARTIKGYDLLDRIGEGAYGAVFRARQQFVDRDVAVKFIQPQFANQPDFVRRFETEAQLIANLEHLHIVPLYDFWRDPDGAYLVMRLMKGGSLQDSIRQNGPWEPIAAAKLVDQVASALDAAHQKGVIHRDLKPGNILLDEDGNAYLSDFGIAKAIGAQPGQTATGAIIGTPAYISPEQAQSLQVSPQTDIYALGVMLFELLTGGHPFPDTPAGALIIKHVNQPLPLLRESHPHLPPEVDNVIQTATSKNPALRYEDALSLAVEFRRALHLKLDYPDILEGELSNPFKGLRAFQEADADDFFGRETLTERLLERLTPSHKDDGQGIIRFLAVVGPSGSGKSSLVKAGLVPALRRGALPGSDQWFITEMVPGTHPLEDLELALLRIAVKEPPSLLGQLKEDPRGLLRAARRVLPDDGQLLLVVDQLEEVFTLVEDPQETAYFLQSLYEAVIDPKSPLKVVVTLRADFYDRPLMHPDFSALIQNRTEVVVPLTSEELAQAIRCPAEAAGAVLEKGLVTQIVADVVEQPGALPLLQYALTELFERRQGRQLTQQVYQSIAGVLGALGKRAEEVYQGLDDDAKTTTRQIFLRLVTLGEGVEDTRRRVLKSELDSIAPPPSPTGGRGDGGEGDKVLDSFGRARLLSFDRDPITRGPTVEVAHEALLKEWRRLGEWLDESRVDVRTQRVLGNSTSQWQGAGQDASFLLRGSRLMQFEEWAETTNLALTADERQFLEASLESREKREAEEAARQAHEAALERRSRNFLRGLVGVFAIATIISLVLAWLAISAQNQTRAQQEIAQSEAEQRSTAEAMAFEQQEEALTQSNARATAEYRNTLRQEEENRIKSAQTALRALEEVKGPNPELAVLVPLELLKIYPYTPQTERVLNEAVLNTPTHMIPRMGSESLIVPQIYWSPDGGAITTPLLDNAILIQDINTGKEVLTIPTAEGCNQVKAWSPSGDRLPAFGDDCPPVIYSAQTGEQVAVLDSSPFVRFSSAAWSPDGSKLATGDQDTKAKIWDAATGQMILELTGHGHYVSEVAWSPNGEQIATASRDQTARVWDAVSGKSLLTFRGHIAPIEGLSWSPDGQKITSAGFDNVAYVWDPSDRRILLRLTGHRQGVPDVAWSPDGSKIATSSWDQTVRIWDSGTGAQLFQFETHSSLDNDSISWSPSGEQLLIAGMHYHRVWDLSQLTPLLEGHTDLIIDAQYSPDGQLAATSSRDNTIRIWEAQNGKLLKLYNLEDQPVSIAWSPDGEYLALSSLDGLVVTWGIDSGDKFEMNNTSKSTIDSLTWSPDGSILAGLEKPAGIIRAWEADSGEGIQLLGENQDCIPVHISWSYENGYLLVGCHGDTKLRILDLTRGEPVGEIDTASEKIITVVWSSNGNYIAIGYADGNIDVFQVLDIPNEALSLPSQGYEIMDLSWSPNSQRIASAESGGAVRIWDLTSQGEVSIFQVPGSAETVDWSANGDHIIITTSIGTSPVIRRVWQSTKALISFANHCCAGRELTPEERTKFELALE